MPITHFGDDLGKEIVRSENQVDSSDSIGRLARSYCGSASAAYQRAGITSAFTNHGHIQMLPISPKRVGGKNEDPDIAEWLETGPVLRAHKPIHVQRREHDAFIDKVKPPIGCIEHIAWMARTAQCNPRLLSVECYIRRWQRAIYMHGGGFIVGSLDQFDTAMRRLCEGSDAQVYSVDYKLTREYRWPVQIEEGESMVRWLPDHAAERGVDPSRIALGFECMVI